MALLKVAFTRVVRKKRTLVRFAPEKSAPLRSMSANVVPVRLSPLKSCAPAAPAQVNTAAVAHVHLNNPSFDIHLTLPR
jgi:hypothetical protein